MSKHRPLMLQIGIGMAILGAILIVAPVRNEPLWVQWILGFGLFYVGLPVAIVGAAVHFVGRGPKNPFSAPASPAGTKKPTA